MKIAKNEGLSEFGKKYRFKDTLNLFCWISVFFTIIVLISVFLSTHNIYYIKLLDSYYSLQVSMSITMFLWAVRFWMYGKTYRVRFAYSLISFGIAICSILFIILNVY